jgi:hypothetical protein
MDTRPVDLEPEDGCSGSGEPNNPNDVIAMLVI